MTASRAKDYGEMNDRMDGRKTRSGGEEERRKEGRNQEREREERAV